MLQVYINGQEVLQVSSINLTRSISTFVDSFDISVGNPDGINSRKYPIGSMIQFYSYGTEVFRGIIEDKNVGYNSVGSDIDFSGREELVYLTEDDLPPNKSAYKNVTDNFIIEDICKQYGFLMKLGEAVQVKEYSLNGQARRKGQVIEEVASMNNFIVYKKGATLIKKKLPTVDNFGGRKAGFRLTKEGGEFHNLNDRIISLSISESISNARSSVQGFTYSNQADKTSYKSKMDNTYLMNGTYPKRLRNTLVGKYNGLPLSRNSYLNIPVKEAKELENSMKKIRIDNDIDITIDLTVYGIANLDLLDAVEIYIEEEGIAQYFYIESLKYRIDGNNKQQTELTMRPLLPKEFV